MWQNIFVFFWFTVYIGRQWPASHHSSAALISLSHCHGDRDAWRHNEHQLGRVQDSNCSNSSNFNRSMKLPTTWEHWRLDVLSSSTNVSIPLVFAVRFRRLVVHMDDTGYSTQHETLRPRCMRAWQLHAKVGLELGLEIVRMSAILQSFWLRHWYDVLPVTLHSRPIARLWFSCGLTRD